MSDIPDKNKAYWLGPLYMEQVAEIQTLIGEGALRPVQPSRYWMALGEDAHEETIYSRDLGCELIAVQAVLMPDDALTEKDNDDETS